MQVYKFGGASIATPERMKALFSVLREAKQPVILVISALGKTTNALEVIVTTACKGDKEEAQKLAKDLEQQHLEYAKELLDPEHYTDLEKELNVYFTEMQWAIDGADASRYDYSYDQIVCLGEVFSTKMLSLYLKQKNYNHEWVDVRDVLRTDDTYRDAKVDLEVSKQQAQHVMGNTCNRVPIFLPKALLALHLTITRPRWAAKDLTILPHYLRQCSVQTA